MKIIMLLCLCALAFASDSQNSNSNPVVQSAAGPIRGSTLQSRLGKQIYSFRGIRYAEAPTGERRFKEALPVRQYNDVFDATEDGPSCPQPVTNNRVISEDCLRLNVYTTALPSNSSDSSSSDSSDNASGSSSGSSSQNQPNRDVIVFIHPGAFYSFSGTSFDFGPQNLLDKNMVLVTINYRLGSLGFLSTGDSRAPGNAGLKDQVLALRWVRDNIRNFGGNPNSVTLLGYSAGAWSVSLHIASPLSKGLFHRAIAMSGSATNQNRLPSDQKDIAKKQAEILGCPTDFDDNTYKCLYSKSAEEYANSLPKFAEFYGDPVLIWLPVVERAESSSNNEEAFLTRQPIDLLREGNFNNVPIMTGVNKDEFGGVVIIAEEQAQHGNSSIYEAFNSIWEQVAPISFAYERNTPRSSSISRGLRSFYLNDQPIQQGKYHGLARLYADALITFQVYRLERLIANYSSEPVYNYHYVYPGCESFSKWSNGSNFGVVHHDELLLLFKTRKYPEPCQRDIKTLDRLTGIIANFARNGEPIPQQNAADYSNVKWERSTQNQPQHLEIAEELSLVSGPVYEKRINEWEKLFPLPPVGADNENSNSNSRQSRPVRL